MSWDCNNACHVITTNIARQIIDANSPLTLPFVEFTDLNGSHFHVNVSDAPCLKIVIDLKDGGGLVLQKIGTLLDNLAFVRNEIYASDALRKISCDALCPVPFRAQLSKAVELIVCEGCNPCCCPQNNDGRYLMLIAFFLALLALLYFMSLLCKFWRNWYCPCPCSCPAGERCQFQNTVNTDILPIVTIPSDSNNEEHPLILPLSDQPTSEIKIPTVVASDLQVTPPELVLPGLPSLSDSSGSSDLSALNSDSQH